jgi:N-acetylglucosamine kinase-like BadF-type ATPase
VGLLADAEGRIVASARGDGANLRTAGELGVEKVLHTVMDEVLGHRDIVPAAICLGVAGVDREADGRIMRGIMRRIALKTRTLIVNDALVALVAGVGDGAGVVLISGTGSIVYGRDERDRAARAGGWGHILGDEGSGYWIGRRALAATVRQADGRGRAGILAARVLGHLGVSAAADLVPLLYDQGMPLPDVAALGAVVDAARADGDPEACAILHEAVGELVLAAESVVRRLDLHRGHFPFVLAGGGFRGVPWLADEVGARLIELAPFASILRLEAEPALGAVHLALAEARGGARLPTYVDTGQRA